MDDKERNKQRKKRDKKNKTKKAGKVFLAILAVMVLCAAAFLITLKFNMPDFQIKSIIPEDKAQEVVRFVKEDVLKQTTTTTTTTTKPTTTRPPNYDYAEFDDFAFDTSLQGNQVGNLLNKTQGAVTFSAAYDYFSIPNDGIYRFEPNNETNARVRNGNLNVKYLNVLGDYIYYVDANTNKLMRSDNVGGNDTEISDDIAFAYLYSDKLYFIGTDNTVGYITTKDFSKTVLYSAPSYKKLNFVGISLSRIFFTEYEETTNEYKYITVSLTDKSDKQCFMDETIGDALVNLQLEGGYFYYYQKQDNGFYNLIRQKFGSEKTVTLLKGCSLTDYPVIYANRLYYTQLTNGYVLAKELNMNSMESKTMLFAPNADKTADIGVGFGYQYIFLSGKPNSQSERIFTASSIYTSSSDQNTISFGNGAWSY